MTTVVETDEAPARFCSNAAWNLTEFDGPEQTGWFGADDDDFEGGVEVPELGLADAEIDPAPAPSGTALQEPPNCGRNVKRVDDPPPGLRGPLFTFRIKFGRAGEEHRPGMPVFRYYQYHVHWQIKQPYASNTTRSTLSVNRTLPSGRPDTALDDSDTRRVRGAKWMPWYAHFLRLRVRPGTLMHYAARSVWTFPYRLPDNSIYRAHRFTGSCRAVLREEP